MGRRKKRRSKRGFPVSVLVGLHEDRAVFWKIYSEKIKPEQVIKRGRKRKNQDEKQLYHFHEEIVNLLRKIIKGGIRSIVLVNSPKTEYNQEFFEHVEHHHQWMLKKGPQQAVFAKLEGNASNAEELFKLVQYELFQEKVEEASNTESSMIIKDLEEILNRSDRFGKILYKIKPIEELIDHKWKKYEQKPNYLLLTDTFLNEHPQKNRIHRIIQVAKNNGIKSKIIYSESDAGKRLKQLGGMVCYIIYD
ncbi:MAG: hypothetical protein GF364_09655 [Candidatus Lokiarchaeota archaeon]|nr:hypothetical protein [Candidatus Lokiarchaeota archaeon]